MLGRDQVDIVDIADVLELQVPFGQLLRREIKAFFGVGYVIVLAKTAT